MEYALLLKSHSEEQAQQLLNERYSLQGSQKPFLVLHEGVNDKAVEPQRKIRKRHIRKSQASQALQRFKKTGDSTYSIYLKLNEHWNAYIKHLGTQGDTMLTADWHGALVQVKRARNPSLIGRAGILLWESKTQFLVVCQDNKFRVFPKQGTLIELVAGNNAFEIIGDRVMCRSTERTTRKFKPHDVDDIAPLVNLLP